MFPHPLYQHLFSGEEDCLDVFLKSWKRRRDEEEEDDIEDDILTNRLIQRAAFNSSSTNQPPTKKQRAENNENILLNTMIKRSSHDFFLLTSRTNAGHQRVRQLLHVKNQHLKELQLYTNMLEGPDMQRRLLIEAVFEKIDDVDDQMEEAKAALSVAMNALKNFDEVDYYGQRADEILREKLGIVKKREVISSSINTPPTDIYVCMSASVDSLSDVTATDTEDD